MCCKNAFKTNTRAMCYGSAPSLFPCVAHTTHNEIIFKSKSKQLKSVSVMGTVFFIYSTKKVGNGNWKSVIQNFRIFARDPGISEAVRPLHSHPQGEGRGVKRACFIGFFLEGLRRHFFHDKGAILAHQPPPPSLL